jgi:hypothetical protein
LVIANILPSTAMLGNGHVERSDGESFGRRFVSTDGHLPLFPIVGNGQIVPNNADVLTAKGFVRFGHEDASGFLTEFTGMVIEVAVSAIADNILATAVNIADAMRNAARECIRLKVERVVSGPIGGAMATAVGNGFGAADIGTAVRAAVDGRRAAIRRAMANTNENDGDVGAAIEAEEMEATQQNKRDISNIVSAIGKGGNVGAVVPLQLDVKVAGAVTEFKDLVARLVGQVVVGHNGDGAPVYLTVDTLPNIHAAAVAPAPAH